MTGLQVRLWKRSKSSYPAANLSDIAADVSYFPAGLPVCPVDGTSYTINTTTGRVIGQYTLNSIEIFKKYRSDLSVLAMTYVCINDALKTTLRLATRTDSKLKQLSE